MKESFAPTKRVLSVRRIGACAGSPKLKNSPGYTPAKESTLDTQTTADTETMANGNADDTRVPVTVLPAFLVLTKRLCLIAS